MKTLFKIILSMMLLVPFYSQAQFTTKTNPAIKTSPALANPKLNSNLIQASKLPKLEPPKVLKESEINAIPIIRFSPEELERNRQKSWEITPRKPYDTGFGLTHWGTFTNSAFLMTPVVRYVVNVSYNYVAYSMRLTANLLQGKDYRLVISVEPQNFPTGSTLAFKVGTSEFRIEWPNGKSEIIILFNNSYTGEQVIDISPVNVPGRGERIDSKLEYSIKSIRLEELAV